MARKIAVPSEQLERLKELYSQEREALVTLASAQEVVSSAEEGLGAAQQVLKDAQSGVDAAYQALVALVGASVAAELTGRNRSGSRRARAKHPDGGGTAGADRSLASRDHEASPAVVGAVAG